MHALVLILIKSLVKVLLFHVLFFLKEVEFSFTEDDFRANEPDLANPVTFLPVLVSKSTRIASRVELVVVPLTVEEARATSIPLPPNVPLDDIRSPPFASKKNIGYKIIIRISILSRFG